MRKIIIVIAFSASLAACVSTQSGRTYVGPGAPGFEVTSTVVKDTAECAEKNFKGCVEHKYENTEMGTNSVPEGLTNEELEGHAKKASK